MTEIAGFLIVAIAGARMVMLIRFVLETIIREYETFAPKRKTTADASAIL